MAAAPYPIINWRMALRSGGAPDSRPTMTPVTSSATPTSAAAISMAVGPPSPNR